MKLMTCLITVIMIPVLMLDRTIGMITLTIAVIIKLNSVLKVRRPEKLQSLESKRQLSRKG